MIYHGWKLEKIHDIVKLLKEAIKFDDSFKEYLEFARFVTDFYFESRYPVGCDFEYTKEEMQEVIERSNKLIALIKEKVPV